MRDNRVFRLHRMHTSLVIYNASYSLSVRFSLILRTLKFDILKFYRPHDRSHGGTACDTAEIAKFREKELMSRSRKRRKSNN